MKSIKKETFEKTEVIGFCRDFKFDTSEDLHSFWLEYPKIFFSFTTSSLRGDDLKIEVVWHNETKMDTASSGGPEERYKVRGKLTITTYALPGGAKQEHWKILAEKINTI